MDEVQNGKKIISKNIFKQYLLKKYKWPFFVFLFISALIIIISLIYFNFNKNKKIDINLDLQQNESDIENTFQDLDYVFLKDEKIKIKTLFDFLNQDIYKNIAENLIMWLNSENNNENGLYINEIDLSLNEKNYIIAKELLKKMYQKRIGYTDTNGSSCMYQNDQNINCKNYFINNEEEEMFTIKYNEKLWKWKNGSKKINNVHTNLNWSDFSINDYKFEIERENTSCEIIYANFEFHRFKLGEKDIPSHFYENKRNGITEIIKENHDKFLKSAKTNELEEVSGYSNKSYILVPNFPYENSKYGFLLISKDEQPLLEVCIDEFYNLLDTRLVKYPITKLSNKSNGALSLVPYEYVLQSSNIDNNNYNTNLILMFSDFITQKEEIISPEIFLGDLRNDSDFFLNDNKLFYISQKIPDKPFAESNFPEYYPRIKSVNLFTGKNETIPLKLNLEEKILSFIIKDNILYYTIGVGDPPTCEEYMGRCDYITLNSYNLKSGISNQLATHIPAQSIDSIEGNEVLLSFGFGDGGGCSVSYYSFNIMNKIRKDLGDRPCNDNLNIHKNWIDSNYIIVKDGKLLLDKSKIDYDKYDKFHKGEFIHSFQED